METIRGRNLRQKRPNGAADAVHVGLPRAEELGAFSIGPAPASLVRRRVDVIDEPRLGSDRCTDPERLVLPADERLEVIVDDRFAQRPDLGQRACVEKDRVPPEAVGQPADGRLRTFERSGDLPVSRSGDEVRRHHRRELGALQVVRSRKRLTRAGALARLTLEARNPRRVVLAPVACRLLKAGRWSPMSSALRPWTERRAEARGTHGFGGMLGPSHEAAQSNADAWPEGPS